MGLFDEIRWDAPLPADHPEDCRIFQTKSLDAPCLDHFIVTPGGRLLLVGSGMVDDDLETAQVSDGVDVDFHGDLRLVSAKGQRHYVARFTHGAVEWIRPLGNDEAWTTVAEARMKFAKNSGQADH